MNRVTKPAEFGGYGKEPGRRSLLNVAQQRAILYLKSNPGPNNAGPNTSYHSKAKTLASGSWPYGLDHAEWLVSELMDR
jgi:hypothetical protein